MARLEDQDLDERRLARRQRRKKSQLVAYITLGTIFVLIAGLIVFGIHMLSKTFAAKPQAQEEVAESVDESSQEVMTIETPQETQEVVEYSEEQLLSEVMESILAEMTLEDKVAGLFIVTPEQLTGVETAVKAGSGTQEALAQYAVGGVAYAPKNIKSTDQIKEMLTTTGTMSKYPVFTILSQQAGASDSIRSTLGLSSVSELEDEKAAKDSGLAAGGELFKNGFNFAIFPDMIVAEDNPFGDDFDRVKELTAAYAEGVQEAGVVSCGYLFPVRGDTVSGMSANEATRDELVVKDYEVFKNAIDRGIEAIMVSNVSLPGVVGDNTPASLSGKMIQEELRGTLGFEGIVITAPLNEKAITEYYTSKEAAIEAISAGADMIYIPENFTEAYEGLLSEVRDGSLSEERINESLRRIYSIKYADRVGQISNNN